ncbi:hypothetical protein D9M68_515510 [compost metagenome]
MQRRVPQGRHMAFGHVHHVHVVAHARAVVRLVVVAVHDDVPALAHRDLRDIRHQVVGRSLRVFAQQAALVRADGVEETQARDAPARIGAGEVREHALHHHLGAPVGVDGRVRRAFPYRRARDVAVDRGRGREDQRAHAGALHGTRQREAARHVDVVVAERVAHRAADRLQPRQMQHRVDPVLGEHAVEHRRVAHVAAHELRLHAADACHALQRTRVAVDQRVQHHRQVAGRDQRHAGVASDEAGATRHQNL